MSDGFSLEMDDREFKRFKELPFMVAQTAFNNFMQSATVFAHTRARRKKQGKKRTWLTPAQTASREGKKPKPRGFTSAPGFVPIDTNNLRNSIQWKFNDRGDFVQSFGRIFSGEKYAAAMEARRGFFKRAKDETELELRPLFKKAVKRARAKVQ